ncbi:MAG: hypothetical protein MZW92_57355 [Comamonadaceae bacterium]|nr:hypothetical protein [Comamonadaceae bacterium]
MSCAAACLLTPLTRTLPGLTVRSSSGWPLALAAPRPTLRAGRCPESRACFPGGRWA